ncbi:cyclin-domain-containing protein [Cokeromyces recurvatus]|uniref:cyclin-domain-containing protein n=1 Tax=Cokeromyces recurvatus TaxID=90255 RepID=UPI00221F6CBF|nr:cyclin-domain-containing protein [Cokeromyces recurvatus]KAI7902671.1 cyclin-domain-containing protein [Cokeromyces recurvatus]
MSFNNKEEEEEDERRQQEMVMNIAQFPIQALIRIVASLVESMIEANQDIKDTQITYFHSRTIPTISILSYLDRIYKFTPFTNEVLLSTLIYFDRISNGITINSYNIHRLLVTSITVASKCTSDIYYTNSRYAKVGGLSLYELNQLELELLFLIDFQLHINLETLQLYANQLLSHATSVMSIDPIVNHSKHNILYQHATNTLISSANHNHVDLPLTPPYHPSITEKGKTTTTSSLLFCNNKHLMVKKKNKNQVYSIHQRTTTTAKKKRQLLLLQQSGLISPKEL